MPFPRTTMKDVAQKLGVHVTTVSLALRNSPRLPAETREKIQSLARSMGYHQDPMLSALMAYRSNLVMPKTQPTVAMIFDFENQAELDGAPLPYRLFLAGATSKADELGYRIESYFFEGRSRGTEGRRIGRILDSRGVKGAILCAFRPRTERFEFDLERFSVVQIECQHLGLSLPMVSTDQLMMAREAVRRLAQQGFCRLGMAVGRDEEIYLDHAFTVGFHGEASLHPELKLAPSLLLPNGRPLSEIAPALRQWIRRYKIEAVVSNWTTVALARAGVTEERDVPLIVLGSVPADSPLGGMNNRDTVVGEQAMEQLAMRLKMNQTGPVDVPNKILVPGEWIEGRRGNVSPRRG